MVGSWLSLNVDGAALSIKETILGGHVSWLPVCGGLGVTRAVAPIGEGGRRLLVWLLGMTMVCRRTLTVGRKRRLLVLHYDGIFRRWTSGSHRWVV